MSTSPETARTALRRIFVLLCGTGGTAAVSFLIQLGLAWGLDVASYGRLAAMVAAVNVLTPIASCGAGWLWFQVYGSEGWGAQRWIAVSLRASAVCSCAALVALGAYLALTEGAPLVTILFAVGAMSAVLLGQSLAEMVSARLQLEERYGLLAAWQLLTPLGRALGIGSVFLLGYRDLPAVLAAYGSVGLLCTAVGVVSASQMHRGRLRLRGHGPPVGAVAAPPAMRQVLGAATPYVLMTTFYLVYSQGVVAVVERLLGPTDAAIYNIAFLVMSVACLAPSVVYTKFLASKIFRWSTHDRELFAAAFHVGVAVQLLLGLLAMATVIAAAPLLVPLVFGERYALAVPIVMLLALAIPVRFVLHAYGAAFYSREQMPRKVTYMGITAAASVILNVLLTPVAGLSGAVIAAIAAELCLLLLFFRGADRHIDGLDVWSTFRLKTVRDAWAFIHGGRQPDPSTMEPRRN